MRSRLRLQQPAWLLGLAIVVMLSVLARPTALLTFTLLALASCSWRGRSQRY